MVHNLFFTAGAGDLGFYSYYFFWKSISFFLIFIKGKIPFYERSFGKNWNSFEKNSQEKVGKRIKNQESLHWREWKTLSLKLLFFFSLNKKCFPPIFLLSSKNLFWQRFEWKIQIETSCFLWFPILLFEPPHFLMFSLLKSTQTKFPPKIINMPPLNFQDRTFKASIKNNLEKIEHALKVRGLGFEVEGWVFDLVNLGRRVAL